MLVSAALSPGCGTQAASTNKQKQASFDSVTDAKGNAQNSGVLEFTNHQAVITATARARYNFLILAYGSRIKIVPPLAPDDGLTLCDPTTLARFHATNLWFMDKLHLQYWATMNTYATMPPATLKKNQ